MARRVSLPAADDLFRTTQEEKAAKARGPVHAVPDQPEPERPSGPSPAAGSSTTRR